MDPYHEKDPEKRKQLFDKYVLETANPQLVLVEKHLAKNASGHLVGEEVSSTFPIRWLLDENDEYFFAVDLGWYSLLQLPFNSWDNDRRRYLLRHTNDEGTCR